MVAGYQCRVNRDKAFNRAQHMWQKKGLLRFKKSVGNYAPF